MNKSYDGSLLAEVFFLPCIPQKRPFFWNGTKRRGPFVDLRPEWIDKKRSFRARALF